ncbi:hypothetical protein BDQ17DRAFT_1428899 [Cyathus striatus]|nr:hypothetical protein BDQ17DRAFT_1428899 [Cyathus striatus]
MTSYAISDENYWITWPPFDVTIPSYAILNENPGTMFDQLRKAACGGAGHISYERPDPPKCHPQTRKEVLSNIMDWFATAIPLIKSFIIANIEGKPETLLGAMETQMKNLVVDLLEKLLKIPNISGVPFMVLIDGLDECSKPEDQSRILEMIFGILMHSPVHLKFLIASRPEQEIRKAFSLPSANGICI